MDNKKGDNGKAVTQQVVADGAGLQRTRISAWLNGKTDNLQRDSFLKLSNYFGCSVDWLAEGTGDPFPEKNISTAEKTKNFDKARESSEANKALEQLMREKFKKQCSLVYFDDFFDFIAENYGEESEDVEKFFTELRKTHANYHVWLEEKKQAV